MIDALSRNHYVFTVCRHAYPYLVEGDWASDARAGRPPRHRPCGPLPGLRGRTAWVRVCTTAQLSTVAHTST